MLNGYEDARYVPIKYPESLTEGRIWIHAFILFHENPSRSAVSEIHRAAHLALITIIHSKSLFPPHSNAQFELQQIVLIMCACLNASGCHVIG